MEQVGDHRDIADIVRRQIDNDDLMGFSVDGQVELPPPAARPDAVLLAEPFTLAVILTPVLSTEDMPRLVERGWLW